MRFSVWLSLLCSAWLYNSSKRSYINNLSSLFCFVNRQVPFPDETFDVLYNSYLLDLIQLKDMPVLGQLDEILFFCERLSVSWQNHGKKIMAKEPKNC